ncbi:MAG: hypothetical protein GWP08_17335 [Nitrospiraceae bacterium]|nr:hypothetical protein [Nitrospiraceae bacterium]
MPEQAPAPSAGTKSRTHRFLTEIVELGFVAFATVNAVLLLLQMRDWITLSASLWILIWAAWCPFFWAKHWTVKNGPRWVAWPIFGCAIVFSATTIFSVVAILIRSIT